MKHNQNTLLRLPVPVISTCHPVFEQGGLPVIEHGGCYF